MSTHRLFPPPFTHAPIYGHDISAGSYADVSAADAKVMAGAEAWIDCGQVGATAARPTFPSTRTDLGYFAGVGTRFIDTSLGAVVWWDGLNWRDYTGAAV